MIPSCSDLENGWDLVRGSADPRPISLEEARGYFEHLLEP